ncbi:SRPBCC domain-containing protein [Sphingobacterium sp. UT-1RO-CII-1]|nr:SRPBCC domain-containing protein [Sphingobacterium sp. UT-1RO-CII-1]
MDRTSRNVRVIKTTRDKVYKAFTEKEALEFWLPPNGMIGKINDLELRIGGGFEMSLFYIDHRIEGKTEGNEDRFLTKFVELKPNERVVQVVYFQSDKDEFSGGMMMEVLLEEVEHESTKVTVVFKNIPIGIDPKENEIGTDQSLEKLTKYMENKI